MAGVVLRRFGALWRAILSSPPLTLNGWVAFNLPRTVTALGELLLLGLVAAHGYVLITEPDLPGYFVVYSAALVLCCAIAAGAMVFDLEPVLPQGGWYFGSVVCMTFLVIYLVTRFAGLAGLDGLTGRWDLAPGTFAMVFAAGFIAVHTTVLSGINVAYPRHQQWLD